MSKGKTVTVHHAIGHVSTSRTYTNMNLDEVIAHEVALGNKEVAPLVINGGRIDIKSMAEALSKSEGKVEVIPGNDAELRATLDRMVQEAAGADAERRTAVVAEVLNYLGSICLYDYTDGVYQFDEPMTKEQMHAAAVAIVDVVLPRG